MFVIALVGLSGVGKSTLLAKLEKRIPLKHFAASDVIKAELARSESRSASSEELRLGSVLDNQSLLVSGFARCTQGLEGLVVLDGHTVIDGSCGLIEIPAEVFAAAHVRHIIFLKAHPDQIAERRTNDARSRPHRSPEQIREHQQVAITVTRKIAAQLYVPLTIIQSDNLTCLRELFYKFASVI
jgi:adenylate kinase